MGNEEKLGRLHAKVILSFSEYISGHTAVFKQNTSTLMVSATDANTEASQSSKTSKSMSPALNAWK